MAEPTNGQTPVSRRDIIYLFQAYNRGEFGYDELIERTRAWAEAMRRQHGKCYTEVTSKSSHLIQS